MSDLKNLKHYDLLKTILKQSATIMIGVSLYNRIAMNPEIPIESKKDKADNPRSSNRKYSDYYDAYYDWMPQAREAEIMEAYSEYKESGLL